MAKRLSGFCAAMKALEQSNGRKPKLFELYERGRVTDEVFRCRIEQFMRERWQFETVGQGLGD